LPELDIHEEQSPNPEQKSTSDQLAYRLRQQRIAAEFGYVALKTTDMHELLQEACRLCALGMNSRFAKFLCHSGNGAGFLVEAGVGWNPGVVGKATVGDDMESPAGYAFHTEKAVISNHLDNEERFRTPSLLVEHGIKRALNVIIQSGERRYGVLEVDTPSEGKFDDADVSFMESFAAILGVALQRDERDQQLRQALLHQEVLTQEASHRVKNSLSIVAGLLAMQARTAGNAEVARALKDAGHRVQTIASVHDRLWRSNSTRSVDLNTFITELAGQLAASASGISVECRVEELEIVTEQAVTVGLLVNELVTNAIKYAYDDGVGTIAIELRRVDDDRLRLTVADQGRGLPANFDPSRPNSLGVRLISSLSRQLGGEPRWTMPGVGTQFTLEFTPASLSA
jgi:two-component sensor histidine kinase